MTDIVFGEPKIVKTDVIAFLFGLSVRRINQLVQDHVLVTVDAPEGEKGNNFDLTQTVQTYVKYLSDKANGKSDKQAALKEQILKAEARLKESQADLHQLKTDIAAGKYLSLDDIRLDYGRFLTNFKKLALAIPSRVAGIVGAVVDPVQAREIENDLNREITEMLTTFVLAAEAGDGQNGKK